MIVAKFRRKSRDRNDKQSLSLKSDYSCNSVKRDYKAICNTPSHGIGRSRGLNACALFVPLIYSREVAWATSYSPDIDLRSLIADGSRAQNRDVPRHVRIKWQTRRYHIIKKNARCSFISLVSDIFSEHRYSRFYFWASCDSSYYSKYGTLLTRCERYCVIM